MMPKNRPSPATPLKFKAMIPIAASIGAAVATIPIPGLTTVNNIIMFSYMGKQFKKYYNVTGSLRMFLTSFAIYFSDPKWNQKALNISEKISGGLMVLLVPHIMVETLHFVPVFGQIAAAIIEFMWVNYEGCKTLSKCQRSGTQYNEQGMYKTKFLK